MKERRPEDAVKACYATWSEGYYENYYGEDAPYPPVHTKILRDLLTASGARNVLDAGCGPASFLRDVADLPIEPFGFDLTPGMVEEGRRVLLDQGKNGNCLWEGNVTDATAFRHPDGQGPEAFDSAVCVGVLPHILEEEDDLVIENLRDSVADEGLVVVEARNKLFGLFTLNRYSFDLFAEELIRFNELEERVDTEREGLQRTRKALEERFRMDLPPVRKGEDGGPGYDEVLSRTHNPLILRERFEEAGFSDVQLHFYHYHCLPPMVEGMVPDLFRRESLAMESPGDWRGHFMASAFLVAGRKR